MATRICFLLFTYLSLSCTSSMGSRCVGLFCTSDCSDPPAFPDKYPVYTKALSYRAGTRVRYRCQACCRLIDGSPTATCTVTTSWTKPTLRCDCLPVASNTNRLKTLPWSMDLDHDYEGTCGRPPRPGSMEVLSRYVGPSCLGSTARYDCAPNYRHVTGFRIYKCNKRGRWKLQRNNLQCTVYTCTKEPLANGEVMPLTRTTFQPGESVQSRCFENYRMHGDVTRVCQRQGTWSGRSAKCIAPRCSHPEFPDHGWVSDRRESMVGGTVTYKCQRGYQLHGHPNRTCTADLIWSGQVPTCKAVDCGTPIGPDGSVTLLQGTTTYKSTVDFSCYSEPHKLHQATCDHNGEWRPQVYCSKNCSRPDVGFSVFSDGHQWPMYTHHGGRAPILCKNGGWLSCNDGFWVPEMTECFKGRRCKDLRSSHCEVNMTGQAAVADVISFRARSGQVMFGAASSTCQWNGIWMPPPANCLNSCAMPTVNGSQLTSTQRAFPHGRHLRIVCTAGYQLAGSSVVVCEDGTWNPPVPECVAVQTPLHTQAQTSRGFQIQGTSISVLVLITCFNGLST